MDLSIVVPIFNEVESVEELYFRIETEMRNLSLTYEIIFVDDGSTDGTWNVIEKLKDVSQHFKGIKLKRNYGQTNAMVAGFQSASGEIIITMDGDLQNDPSDIPSLLVKINQGYDIVSGWRKDRKDDYSRVFPSKVANTIISIMTGIKLHDYGCTLKAYRSECIKNINAYAEMHRFFPALASMTGARVAEIPVRHYPRKSGYSKYGYNRIFKVFSDILSMSLIIRFFATPLKGFVFCSVPFIAFSIFFGVLGLASIFLDWTQGKEIVFFIATALSGVAAVHLIVLGILAELVINTSDSTGYQVLNTIRKKVELRLEKE